MKHGVRTFVRHDTNHPTASARANAIELLHACQSIPETIGSGRFQVRIFISEPVRANGLVAALSTFADRDFTAP